MSYNKTTWISGDIVTSEKLNKMENGIADADGRLSFVSTALNNVEMQLTAATRSPLKASTAAAMSDTTKTYIYTGSETGYTFGDWYYYDGSSWTDGGIYNATAFETDKTLTIENMAADSKAVGNLKETLTAVDDTLFESHEPVNILQGDWTIGYTIDNSGELTPNAGYDASDYFEVKGGTKICLTVQETSTTRHILDYCANAFYDKNKTFISRVSGSIKDVPANAVFARQAILHDYNNNNYKPMTEYTDANGTIASAYSAWFEPYVVIKLNYGADFGNKKLCVFGDSLAANGSGGTDTWIQRVGDIFGFDAVYNRGVGSSMVTDGTTMYAYVDEDGDAYNRLAYTSQRSIPGYTEINACCSSTDRANTIPTDTDVLLILCGSNDVGNTPLATFKTAYRTMLDNIYARVPNAKVIVCTMPFHYAFDTGASAEIYENFREAIREAGHEYGFPIIDFKREMMVNKNNYTSFMDSNKVHYNNANGRKRFAETATPHVQDIRYIG